MLHRHRQLYPSTCIRRRLLCLTATAALGSTLSSHVHAFVPPVVQQQQQLHRPTTAVRLFSNDNNNNDKKKSGGGGFLVKVAKSILPKSWTQSEEERRMELRRKEVRDEVSGGLQSLLKDAPFPVRMMGSMMAPLVSGMASSLAETMKDQQEQMQQLLDDARGYIVADPLAVEQLGGDPIVVQPPFSQSSSTSSINGKTTTQIQASFPVQGRAQQGIATMTASQSGIQQLTLQVGGRNMNIQLSRKGSFGSGASSSTSSSSSSGLGRNRINNDDIIDAEFVEKKD